MSCSFCGYNLNWLQQLFNQSSIHTIINLLNTNNSYMNINALWNQLSFLFFAPIIYQSSTHTKPSSIFIDLMHCGSSLRKFSFLSCFIHLSSESTKCIDEPTDSENIQPIRMKQHIDILLLADEDDQNQVIFPCRKRTPFCHD